MIRYMLDTDICSYIIRERPLQVLEHFRQVEMEQLCISVVTYAELVYGVEHSSSKKVNRAVIDDFVRHLTIIPWTKESAEHYGKIRAYLQTKGEVIGSMDMMIAAHARSQNMILVTNNDKHFQRVPKLQVENWVR
ncbi:type II toxin-antitoxin system tRNA(fMet)-specific endonuclease VapC [Desulfogranum japonicum]|uniref:type II toxin-antitoxin system tRNA(fMet)-specific endonuclease VapC n=1 Tax=Desulfogranum japonicum TaxID=231447 RepID=UPI0004915BFB|nr:type II toxin-antitoxin system VapC family toxin [Desulfogranum japonicum]